MELHPIGYQSLKNKLKEKQIYAKGIIND
jgi:hypothetical protein